jgi:hypothetical protein
MTSVTNRKFFSLFFLALALMVGLLASVLPVAKQINLMVLERFFEFMLPILGVGALLKYLFFEPAE